MPAANNPASAALARLSPSPPASSPPPRAGDGDIRPRCRRDLRWSQQDARGVASRWIAFDPLTNTYYTLTAPERRALMLMDGRRSLVDILPLLRDDFPTQLFTADWLRLLTARLQGYHLLVPPSAVGVLRAYDARRRARRIGAAAGWLSPLAIRIPLLDPSGILPRTRAIAALLFHPVTLLATVVLGAVLISAVVRELLSGGGLAVDAAAIGGDLWISLLLCYAAAKSLHEVGHALACARYRVECDEVGVLLLCFAPALYCDTTDAWKLRSKWRRAVISAAGMYVELIIATAAAAIWLATGEGALHTLAASLMIVCSVSTLLVNSNPLLRYDGYYILSDLWGVPNLATQSRLAVRHLAERFFIGRRPPPTAFDASPWALAGYAILSSIYRTFVLGFILWLAWTTLVPLGLGFVAMSITTVVGLGLLAAQVRSVRLWRRELKMATVGQHVRFWLCTFVVVGVLIAASLFPAPRFARGRGVTDYADKRPLYAGRDAELLSFTDVQGLIVAGSPLFRLRSVEGELELIKVRGEIRVLEQKLAELQTRRSLDPAASYQIPPAIEQLAELNAAAAVLRRELDSLASDAPENGYVIAEAVPLPPPAANPQDDRSRLSYRERAAVGCRVSRRSLLGWFTPDRKPSVAAYLAEDKVRQLEIGQKVSVLCDADVAQVLEGTVTRISPEPLTATPPTLVGDESFASTRDARGEWVPESPHYEVTIMMQSPVRQPLGSPVTVSVQLAEERVYAQVIDYVRKNLKPIY